MTTEEPDPQHLSTSKQGKKNPHGTAMAETVQPDLWLSSAEISAPTRKIFP
jgi:hypothetical protein